MNPADQPPCTSDPVHWQDRTDADAVWQCRLGCPRRKWCAKEAWETPHAFGLWAGVIIPAESLRGRANAMKRIASIAGISPTYANQHRDAIAARHGRRTAA